MHNRPCTSRASASCGSSRTSPKPREEQKAVMRVSVDFQCDRYSCKANCSRWPDIHHEESILAWKQLCPFDYCEYKTGDVDSMKENMKCLHYVPSPNPQPYKTSGGQYQTCVTQGGDTSFTHEVTDFVAELGELDEPSQADSGYPTTHTTISFADDLHDSEDSMFAYPEASTYLYGIGHWLEDDSRTGSTWTVWQDPNILLQHSFTLSSASIKKKPHVEEAMNRFQTSFYGATTPGYHTVHK